MRVLGESRRVLIAGSPILHRPNSVAFERESSLVSDLIYIAVGVVILLIFALYAAGLRRI